MADIVTDGSMGPSLSINGPNFQIEEQLGSRSGNNLFHSFQEFNIATGETAVFTGSAGIDNVISRVTGGNLSTINGVLQSTIGAADFYFINPAGILIGETAQIDVPASFYISTANSLHFSDDAIFFGDTENLSSLSIADPITFGFSQSSSANITIDGAVLAFNPETTFLLNAGTIDVNESEILIENGNLNLLTGEKISQDTNDSWFDNTQGSSNYPNNSSINISQSFLDVGGNGAGIINLHSNNIKMTNSALFNANIGNKSTQGYSIVQADNLDMDQAWLINDNGGASNSAPINIHLTNALNMKNNSVISSDSYANGNASKIFLSAQDLSLENSLLLSNSQQGNGNGNQVTINIANDINLLNGSTIGSSTYSTGDAGKVIIETNNLLINAGQTEQFTGIASQAGTGSQGNAGIIQLDVSKHIDIQPGGKISTDSFATGNAGDIVIKSDSLSINRLDNITTGILSQAKQTSFGNAGSINIDVNDTVNIYNGGEISTSTFSQGNAGDITLSTSNLKLNGIDSDFITGIFSNAEQDSTGHAGNLNILVKDALNINYANISSDAYFNSHGNAGQINIMANTIRMDNGAYIGSNTYALGNAGEIEITAENLNINGLNNDYTTGIYSDASAQSVGNAGTINLNIANDLIMQQGLISGNALPNSSGNAGHLNLHIGGLFNLSDDSVLNTSTFSSGDAGVIEITAERINILNGGEISSSTDANGHAGSIYLNVNQLIIDQGGESFTGIFSDAVINSSGNAGQINVNANDSIEILNGGRISSTTFALGDAGQLNINAPNLSIADSNAVLGTGIFSIAAPNSTGQAGAINLIVPNLLQVTDLGGISSDTYAKGNAGNITIEAGKIYLSGIGELYRTGISSNAENGSIGNAGSVTINSDNDIEIYNGARKQNSIDYSVDNNTFSYIEPIIAKQPGC